MIQEKDVYCINFRYTNKTHMNKTERLIKNDKDNNSITSIENKLNKYNSLN